MFLYVRIEILIQQVLRNFENTIFYLSPLLLLVWLPYVGIIWQMFLFFDLFTNAIEDLFSIHMAYLITI